MLYRIYFWCQPSCYRGNCPSIQQHKWTENQMVLPPPPAFLIYLFAARRVWSWAGGRRGGKWRLGWGVEKKGGGGNLEVDELEWRWNRNRLGELNIGTDFVLLIVWGGDVRRQITSQLLRLQAGLPVSVKGSESQLQGWYNDLHLLHKV